MSDNQFLNWGLCSWVSGDLCERPLRLLQPDLDQTVFRRQYSDSTSLHRTRLPTTKFLTEDVALVLGLMSGQKAVDATVTDKSTVDAVGTVSLSTAVEQLAVKTIAGIGRTRESEGGYEQGEGKIRTSEAARRELHRDLMSVCLVEELVVWLPGFAIKEAPPVLYSPTNPLS